MRIRKRHALLSSSHFPATPSSDPHPNTHSQGLVQLSAAAPTTATVSSSPLSVQRVLSSDRGGEPSDQAVAPINGWDDSSGESGAHRQHIKQEDPSVEDNDDYGRREASGEDSEDKKLSNDSRKGGIFGSSQTLPPPPTPQDERWCEEEKAIPLKKRRGTFDNNDAKKAKGKMKSKCSSEEEEKEKVKVKGKKRGRGSAVMEGSRCSRVNGRGWRCCQQTLVGYSLCEHHLGKGRLRSMTSVRNRSSTTKLLVQQQQSSSSISFSEEEEKRRKVIMGKKKMKQLGMVKARSINSLLGQTTNTPIALHDAITTNK
ncbi:hypothetical protein PIB30_027722 [Stylosanthes scabra]|uniref:WRC domain-containing protein n=1 Tax=Stylosanthes scabra TaxID=79078 RepID=A0ABU6WAZ8_9FABA|nr:hypothetical protein [Stylosanthes scabra]